MENLAFVEQQLAADHFIAGSGISAEIDAADKELLAFIGGESQIYLVGIGNRIERRLRHEIDVAELAVELLQLVNALAQLGRRKDIAFLHLKNLLLQKVRGLEEFHPDEIHLAQVKQPALFDGNSNVGSLAGLI